MADYRVAVNGTIACDAGRVYRGLVDFERVQPRLLPDTARDYRVIEGGIGDGTVAAFTMPIRNRDRAFSFRVSEPIPYRAITAYDHGSHLTVTWTLRPVASVTELEIEAYWVVPDDTFGFVIAWWANISVRRMFRQMLDRLPQILAEPDP